MGKVSCFSAAVRAFSKKTGRSRKEKGRSLWSKAQILKTEESQGEIKQNFDEKEIGQRVSMG